MKEWIVTYTVKCHGYVAVEAETKDDAESYVLDQIQVPGSVKWDECETTAEEEEE